MPALNLTPRQARWAAAAALAVPILALGLRFAGGSRSLHGQDYREYYRPHAVFAREQFRRDGELPRWNPTQYAGIPFLGNSQGNFYYPGNWLFLGMGPDTAFETLVLLHLLLAAFGTYRLTRRFGPGRAASAIAALAYALSFSVLMRISAGHLPYFITVCQAPLLLFLLLKAVDQPSLRHTAALGGFAALVLLGGNPQFVYHLGLLSIALAAWRIATRRTWRPLLSLAAAGGLGAAIAAVQLFPSLEVAAWSSRGGTEAADLAKQSQPFHDFSLVELLGFFVPCYPWTPSAESWLPHEKALYLGILPLCLAFWRLGSERLRGPALFFAACALVALLDALGHVLFFLPGASMFRIPERVVWVAVLSLAILAAFGWESAATPDRPRKRLLLGTGVLCAAGAALVLIVHRAPEAVGVLVLAAASIAILHVAPRGPRVAAAAVALAALDLFGFGLSRVPAVPREQLEAPPWYARAIGQERNDGRLLDLTSPHAGPVAHGFRLFRGCGYPVPVEVSRYFASGWTSSQPRMETMADVGGTADPTVLRRLNIRWIVTGAACPAPGWVEVARQHGDVLYRDPFPQPHAFLEDSHGLVVFRRPTASSMTVQASLTNPGRLVVSEAWIRGWTAERNGLPIPVASAPGGLLAVDLPDGESRLTFVYAPASWKAGRIVTGLGLLALAGLLVPTLRRGGKRQEAPAVVR